MLLPLADGEKNEWNMQGDSYPVYFPDYIIYS